MTAKTDNIISNIEGYSSAMYSTWIYYRPCHLLFDAGEGVSLSMRNHIFGVETVLISHAHYDHIGGLAGMIFSRASAMGDKEKPLTIYYPMGDEAMSSFKSFIRTSAGHIKYDLKWIEVEAGDEIKLEDRKLTIEAFEAMHYSNRPCLGYKIVEDRARLKPEFVGKPGYEIAKLVAEKGKSFVNYTYRKNLIAYSGDTSPVRPSVVAGAEVLIHEATFVGEEEMTKKGHSSIEGAINVASEAGVEALVLYHLSGRYTVGEALYETRRVLAEVKYDKPVYFLAYGEMIRVQ
jgi:ribonuclease Z